MGLWEANRGRLGLYCGGPLSPESKRTLRAKQRDRWKIDRTNNCTMHSLLLTLVLASFASSEIAPWLAEPYISGNQGYQSGQGYSNGGQQGYQQVAFHAQRASPYSRKGSPITFERSLTNLGGGWGRSGSTFTCPISGTYHF